MALYYLHLRDGTDEILDPEGLNCSDIEQVRKAVVEAARDLMASDLKTQGTLDFRYRIDAEDEAGNLAHSLEFADAVRVISKTGLAT